MRLLSADNINNLQLYQPEILRKYWNWIDLYWMDTRCRALIRKRKITNRYCHSNRLFYKWIHFLRIKFIPPEMLIVWTVAKRKSYICRLAKYRHCIRSTVKCQIATNCNQCLSICKLSAENTHINSNLTRNIDSTDERGIHVQIVVFCLIDLSYHLLISSSW